MVNYQIITDSGSDLPADMLAELNVKMISLTLLFRNQNLKDSVSAGIEELYAGLRGGEVVSTSAVNPDGWTQIIESTLKEEKDVLILAFSSGLSTTYQSAVIAANELRSKYPLRKINVVDTRSASLGQGLLVWHACQKRDAGMSLEELTAWAEEYKFKMCHWFTVDDLMYLKRGGRISAATALLGTVLKIKPVLHMDDAGHLINVTKARGRKASIEALADKVGELGLPGENETMFICHGDCRKDADYLADILKKKYGAKKVFIGYTGAVIGSHSGPGTLSVFFLGRHR